MAEENLIEKADTIINQSIHTDDDIKELAKIKYHLCKLVREYDVSANSEEEKYNHARGQLFVKAKAIAVWEWRRYTDSEAERLAKNQSEERYGKYRSMKANVRGMYGTIEAVGQFIITLQSERKNSITWTYWTDQTLRDQIIEDLST